MHRKIVEQIDAWITKWNEHHAGEDKHQLLESFVRKNPNGDGFWGMMITAKPEYKHFLPHVQRISLAIGGINGEGLWTQLTTHPNKSEQDYLELS